MALASTDSDSDCDFVRFLFLSWPCLRGLVLLRLFGLCLGRFGLGFISLGLRHGNRYAKTKINQPGSNMRRIVWILSDVRDNRAKPLEFIYFTMIIKKVCAIHIRGLAGYVPSSVNPPI